MSHNVNAFIGPRDELERLTFGLKHAKISDLDVEGFGLLPYTSELAKEIGKRWFDLGKEAIKPLVHIETDYFGGPGTQSAAYWNLGKKAFAAKRDGAINEALKMLHIQPEPGMDLFDTIGLGSHRNNDHWAKNADDSEEADRLDALRILDELQRARES